MSVENISSAGKVHQAQQQSTEKSSNQHSKSVTELTQAQQQKASMNVAILESAQVTIGAVDEPLSLLLKTAIDSINEVLAPELGDDALQKAADSGLDVSPEATAERIVSLSTNFYNAFKQQHPGEDESTVLQNFIDTISGGIEKGFNEARHILEGLQVLEGDIATDIDKTFTLVQEKLVAFESAISEQISEQVNSK